MIDNIKNQNIGREEQQNIVKKKIYYAITIAALVLAALIVFYFVRKNNNLEVIDIKKEEIKETPDPKKAAAGKPQLPPWDNSEDETLQMDIDGDYLLGYKEVYFYKTDPNNPDTDNDGFKDGDEVRNGYNPNGEGRL